MERELQKKFQCKFCGKEFLSTVGAVCPHCNRPQNVDKLPPTDGDSIKDIFKKD